MNEFTKEELIEILGCVRECSFDSISLPYYYDSILEKLKSMIDNYCGHKYTQSAVIHTQTTGYGNRCIKCKKFV